MKLPPGYRWCYNCIKKQLWGCTLCIGVFFRENGQHTVEIHLHLTKFSKRNIIDNCTIYSKNYLLW